ncbi:hypothetical protein AB0P36_26660 [Streptomyces flavidovirens]|uniref:hypothetical protein n=1 Tax=Streptomyces flavidovirens TaxID=67298 RepID=UPI00342715AB
MGGLRVDDLAVLRALLGPRHGDVTQSGLLGPGECGGQTRREREHDAPVIILAGDDTRLTRLDEFLEAAAGKQAFPLDDSLLGIEVAEGERFERTPRPGPKCQSR